MIPPTDTQLFLRWRDGGDEAALRTLESSLRRNGAMWRMCQRLSEGLARCDADDIWQHAWSRAVRYAPSFTPSGQEDAFRRWFTRILQNAFRDQLRAQLRTAETALDEAPPATIAPHTSSTERRASARVDVQRALDQLPQDKADVVRLQAAGWRHSEIAEHLNISEANSRQRAKRGMALLRRLLGVWERD